MNLVPLLAPSVAARTSDWNEKDAVRRLWSGDPTVWSDDPELPELADRLGWLRLHETMRPHVEEIVEVGAAIRSDSDHVVLCGMGGSSLAPEVFARTYDVDTPELIIADSTHPEAIRQIRALIDPTRTTFVVSSKSGTTLETLSAFRYFWAEAGSAGSRFVAITDPGTPLASLATERGFRRCFETIPDVGGRFSALTHFGLVPAAILGIDPGALLDSAAELAAHAADNVRDDPAVGLGIALAELARRGRDKLTFVTSPGLASLPAWMEQLIAESLGKDGTGIVPVADEPARGPSAYADDRVFLAYRLAGEPAPDLDALNRAGQPVLGFELPQTSSLGYEMLRAEVATAAAGAVLGVHPFDQPNVEAAKRLAKQAMEGSLDLGSVPTVAAGSAADELGRFLDGLVPGDYVGIHAYLAPEDHRWSHLQELRKTIGARTGLATTLGWGPRFLHSTGQLHKGGPETGAFIQLIDRPASTVEVPESGHEFGAIIAAQSAGDFQALTDAGKRVIRIDLGRDPDGSIAALAEELG
ncbi:MAG: glucose-6-phosphate isomerase [Acidimicrobiia bacterium]|nr:glucose-6-phosphate isomerase [Acidimicrobiia bacterium]